MKTSPATPEELEELANEALDLLGQRKGHAGVTHRKRTPDASRRSVRAFLLTWGDLDGWSRYYNPNEIAAQLKDDDWEMFERVLAETIAFADEVRALRTAAVPA
jgi:ParB family chromosome partitioning protein